MLLDVEGAREPPRDGQQPAGVLVPLFAPQGPLDDPAALGVVLTRRRADMRRHAGEISFPGGRRDPRDQDLLDTALREAEEEIGLPAADVTVIGALHPVSTFVTNYAIHPFVGLLGTGREWRLSPREVDEVLELTLGQLRDGFAPVTIERRGLSFATDAYTVDGNVIWGATARILADLLARLGLVDPA